MSPIEIDFSDRSKFYLAHGFSFTVLLKILVNIQERSIWLLDFYWYMFVHQITAIKPFNYLGEFAVHIDLIEANSQATSIYKFYYPTSLKCGYCAQYLGYRDSEVKP